MKKCIGLSAALLLTIAALLPACKKSTPREPADPFTPYVERYQNISLHNASAMDPFYVAHRLNLYLSNGATDALRQELFPGGTVTTEDGETYVIDFEPEAAPTGDYLRYGQLIVHTGGTSLSDPGTVWELAVDPDDPFLVDGGQFGAVNVGMGPGDYTIEAVTSNRWVVRGTEISLRIPYSTQTALWNVEVRVSQVQGGTDGHLADLRFQVETSGRPGMNGGLTFDAARYRYEALSPILYMLSCNPGSKSGGREWIIRMDNYDYAGKDTIEVDLGAQFVCDPSFTMSTRIDSVWTTQQF